MEFAILGNCTAHLPGVLRPGTWAMVPHFLFMLPLVPGLRMEPLSRFLDCWSRFLFWRWSLASDYGPTASGPKGSPLRYEHPTYIIAEAVASQFQYLLPFPTLLLQLQVLCLMTSWAALCIRPLLPSLPISRFPSPGSFPVLLAAQVMLCDHVLRSGKSSVLIL